MTTAGLLIIAHAPLASALRACVLHVMPDDGDAIAAVDICSDLPFEQLVEQSRLALERLNTPRTMILSDMVGATPCNVAQQLVAPAHSRLVAGVNLPMVLRAMTLREKPLDELVKGAVEGGIRGIVPVATPTPPQNQPWKPHDQDPGNDQQ